MTKDTYDLVNFDKKTIVLVGHMGCGKSTIGRILSKKLKWEFFDTDKEIEKKQNKTILEIFKKYGENFFREKEEFVLKNLLKKNYTVISLGGGALTRKNIRNMIEKKAISIFLKVDIDILVKRLKNSKNRPLLINTDIKEKILSLDAERLFYYNKANIIVMNSERSQKTISKIMEILKN
tara:strand:- start:4310 stop:4846 length:537 start_codon:yes stop_codon:yes gene_type:complete